MPKVVELPIGTNASMIRGLSERTRAMEAQRGKLGICALTTSMNTYVGHNPSPPFPWYVPGLPRKAFNIGPSGSAWVMVNAYATNTFWDSAANSDILVDDGATSTGGLWSAPWGTVTGLTPGWHTFSVGLVIGASVVGNYQIDSAWLSVWPV